MGGYAKRCAGLTAHIKVENPAGYRLQKLFIGDEEARPETLVRAAFVTEQGVPSKYGRNRKQLDRRTVQVLREYLARHQPAEVRSENSVIAV